MGWMFLSRSNWYIEIITPNVMLLGGGAFERWLRHEGGTFMSGISDLVKRDPRELSDPFHRVKTHQEDSHLRTRSGPSPDTKYTEASIMDFPTPELWEINLYF